MSRLGSSLLVIEDVISQASVDMTSLTSNIANKLLFFLTCPICPEGQWDKQIWTVLSTRWYEDHGAIRDLSGAPGCE